MNQLVAVVLVFLLSNPVYAAECANQGDTFSRYQVLNKGMLDLTMAGKMNKSIGDDIGTQSKAAQELANNGEYQKACDIYDKVIAHYGFKTFEQSYYEAHPEKRPTAEKPKPASASASASISATDEAADSSKSD